MSPQLPKNTTNDTTLGDAPAIPARSPRLPAASEVSVASALRNLAARVEALERRISWLGSPVDAALRHRGWRVGSHSRVASVLLPRPADPDRLDRYYEDLRRYHFRRLLQEAAEKRALDSDSLHQLEQRWGIHATSRTLARLVAYGLLDRRPEGYAIRAPLRTTFGDTLEWFVAQVFIREFLAPAAWDVRLLGIREGGDFDVLTVVDGRLGYVECKGSPPYNVSVQALDRFLGRVSRLAPDFAIFLIDTTLLVERNIIDNLRRLLTGAWGSEPPVVRASAGLFQVGGDVPLFVVTSRRSLVENLQQCLRRLFGVGPHRREPGLPPLPR